MPKAKRNSKPSPRRTAKPRKVSKVSAKPLIPFQPCANDNEETLWRPLPGHPHSEYLEVANHRLIRRREFPGAKSRLRIVGSEEKVRLYWARGPRVSPEVPA